MYYKREVPQKRISIVTKIYKITTAQDEQLLNLEKKLHIPASSLVRLALDCFLPKVSNMEVTEEGILNLWNSEKF